MVDLCHSPFRLAFYFKQMVLRSSIVSSSAQLFKGVFLTATDMNKLARLFHS